MTEQQNFVDMAARARKAQEAVNALGAGKPEPVVEEPPTAEELYIVRKLRALYEGTRGAEYPTTEELDKIDLKTVVPEFAGIQPVSVSTYSEMSLGEVIEYLRAAAPGDRVRLSDVVFSYRGYYDRPCVEPTRHTGNVRDVADRLEAYVGTTMQGWKGGDYEVSKGKILHVAVEGDTGPSIIGFRANPEDPTLLEPIFLKESFHW